MVPLPSMAEVGHREGQWLSSLLTERETSQQAPGWCQALIEVYSVTRGLSKISDTSPGFCAFPKDTPKISSCL